MLEKQAFPTDGRPVFYPDAKMRHIKHEWREAIIISKLRIGIVGLGEIAQKVYLPFLSQELQWSIAGAYSPTAGKRKEVCDWYRINEYRNLPDLIQSSDVLFVHSSTASHYEIVSEALKKGRDVYVDKPLAANLEDAEKLADLSVQTGRKLMVGFNRRFAPLYVQAKEAARNPAWVRIEKHRVNSIRPEPFADTIYDDYLHLIDTARWLGEPQTALQGCITVNQQQQLIYAQHSYRSDKGAYCFMGMHRQAGTNLELLEFVGEGSIIRVENMERMAVEQAGKVTVNTAGSWDTIIKRRGFADAIWHFINSVIHDTEPTINALEGFKSQKLAYECIRQMK